MSERILVFIPVYNCEKQIGRVLAKFDKETAALFSHIIVVDNGSRDRTVENAEQAARGAPVPVTIIRNDQNYNLGGSIKSAFLYAIANGYDYIVTLHGDDQGDIGDMAKQIRTGLHRDNDFIVGARFHKDSKLIGYSRFRIFGNKVLGVLYALVTRRRIDDRPAGLNCYRVDLLRSRFFLPFPNDLTFDAHLFLYAIWKKARFAYFPILWREEDQISNAKVFRQAWTEVKLLIGYTFTDRARLFSENKSGFPLDFRYPGTPVFNNAQAA